MAPNINSATRISGVLFEDDKMEDIKVIGSEPEKESSNESEEPFKGAIAWHSVLTFTYVHIAGLYGLYLLVTSAKTPTIIYTLLSVLYAGSGITTGAHRLWSHRAYKATLPVRIFLMIGNMLSGQKSVIKWARDHRVHHKFSETNADPHNIKRGFFFAHVGWLMIKKHPDVKKFGKGVDLSDLYADPVLAFQHKYYWYLKPLLCFIIPTLIPVYLWGESWTVAWFGSTMYRFFQVLTSSFLVNSVAHMWGNRPYDKNISPADNSFVQWATMGEGWHNYHHVFPWDYRGSELWNPGFNVSKNFIELLAKWGLVSDLKTVSATMAKNRAQRTGDGSHLIWGWGDKEMSQQDIQQATIIYKTDE